VNPEAKVGWARSVNGPADTGHCGDRHADDEVLKSYVRSVLLTLPI
jgi:hypothetical protein